MRIPNASRPVVSVVTALVLSAPAIAAAQDSTAETKAAAAASPSPAASPEARRGVRPGDVQKVFVINHVGINDLSRVLSVFPAELSGMDRDNRRVLSVSAAPAVVAAIEETIKRLDVPPPATRSVEVTAYVLECSASGDAGTLPQDLQAVLVQLKKIFNYSGCTLARTLFARGTDDSRFAAEFNEHAAGTYHLTINRIEVDASQPPVVRLHGLDLANFLGVARSRLGGDIEVRDGQKVVLGRLGTTESGRDQIVVLTAKVAP
ncbi:MAG TPA: hypothetical protein VFT38_12645 [Vicinamibacteria bacterium]|nr:hypothetical protein [Vicinamibacteria bacterium]